MFLGCWRSVWWSLDWKPADLGVLQSPRVDYSVEKPCMSSLLAQGLVIAAHVTSCPEWVLMAHFPWQASHVGHPYLTVHHGEQECLFCWERTWVRCLSLPGRGPPCASLPAPLLCYTYGSSFSYLYSQCGSHLGNFNLELIFFQLGFHQKLDSRILQEDNILPAIDLLV